MKTTIKTALILTAFFPVAIQSQAASDKIVSEISGYVYPANRPATAGDFKYMPDGESYLKPNADKTAIARYETKTRTEIETVFNAAKTRESSIEQFEDFSISPDGTKLLIYKSASPIYRHSFNAEYYVFDIKRNILKPLSKDKPLQRAPIFSPDCRMVAFVSDNDIFLRKLDYDTEIAVTDDGDYGRIINGVPDWTYEEEFAATQSMAWSPDSSTLCFIKFDETDVPVYSFPLYQGACNPLDEYSLYPGSFSYKYPVAGKKNSSVSLHSYDVSTRKTKEITFSDTHIEYIPQLAYSPSPEQLIVTTLNRDQNRMEIYSVNPKSTTVRSLITEENNSWIEPSTYEGITLTGKSIIMQSTRSGFNNLYEYSYEGALIRQLTSCDYDITECYGTDAAGNIYFRSTKGDPLSRVVSRLDAKGKVTDLSPVGKTATIVFSPNKNYYTIGISDSSTPPVYTMYSSNGKQITVLEDNSDYASRFGSLPNKEFIKITSDGYELNAYIIKPDDFNKSKSYPVIMWQYSGPGSQSVLNSWEMDWMYYAVKQGFLVFCVDGRGTGGRGRAFQDIVYRNLGHYETIDQVNAAKYLMTLPYIDKNRIGICGWSYGGYETLMAISSEDAPFAAAVAIAPVTDWRFYDTVYTERYMLTPQSNHDGYLQSAPINKTTNVNCRLLLISGTADDNVHLSNTMEYVSRLQRDGKLCDMLLFPNMNHSIYGCNSRAVVYAKMIDFFMRNL